MKVCLSWFIEGVLERIWFLGGGGGFLLVAVLYGGV